MGFCLRYFIPFILLVHVTGTSGAQTASTLSGMVTTVDQEPIQLVNISVDALKSTVYTDARGHFSLRIPAGITQIELRISMVGKKTEFRQIGQADFGKPLRIQLQELTLTMDEISIVHTHEYTASSNSSIVFDEEAIERVQAFSLADVINTLPGRATAAPTIDAPQTISLRNALSGSYQMNNSLGIPIIMDGVNLSNDANMQARSVSQFGMAGSILSGANGYSSGDVPFQGIDLRDIPVETIERVEVIQGIASAEYSEMTDGAIIIERKAGRTPWQFTTNINGGSSNFSLSKGFNVNRRLGALNLGLNYAISNPNPRDKVKEYSRISGSAMWSLNLGRQIKNTFSLDLNKRLDQVKQDPDDDSRQSSFSKNSGFRISNRMNWKTGTAWASNVRFTAAYSRSHQDSYKQWLLNQLPRGYAYKDTTGIYEGIVLSGRYIAEEQIIGIPVTASLSLSTNAYFQLGGQVHTVSYGLSGNYSNNGGKGIIADPDRPRWVNVAGQNARPYSFEYLDPLVNYGFHVADQFNVILGSKLLTSNLGARVDQQNGSWSLQPRLSTRLQWNSRLSFSLAFGIASKSPTMAHRYPAPTFLDIPLILAYNSVDALYLVYTEKMQADNRSLRPSKSTQLEWGTRYVHSWFTSSLNAFWKTNRGGFGTQKVFRSFDLPEYTYHFNAETQQIEYGETGNRVSFYNFGDYRMRNSQNAQSIGLDWMISTKKVSALNTSFNLSTSLIRTEEDPELLQVVDLKTPLEIDGENIWHVLYPPNSRNRSTSAMSKLATTTHIPSLGFVVSTNVDVFWTRRTDSKFSSEVQSPVGYVDRNGRERSFPANMTDLPVRDLSLSNTELPFVYACLNLSVAKEIQRKFRLSVTAYNVLNIQPEHLRYSATDTGSFTVSRYNAPVSITGGITYKF